MTLPECKIDYLIQFSEHKQQQQQHQTFNRSIRIDCWPSCLHNHDIIIVKVTSDDKKNGLDVCQFTPC